MVTRELLINKALSAHSFVYTHRKPTFDYCALQIALKLWKIK